MGTGGHRAGVGKHRRLTSDADDYLAGISYTMRSPQHVIVQRKS